MSPWKRVLVLAAAAVLPLACLPPNATPRLERRTERSFDVAPGSLVRVSIAGGPITITTGAPGRVHATLIEEVYASSDAEAERMLADVESLVAQNGDEVTVSARRLRKFRQSWNGRDVRATATVAVPPDVRVDLGTSGGRIRVEGEREASVSAETSGGSISVDGGTDITADTSGGSIQVERVSGTLDAETSGGSISVEHVAASARDVRVQTSGGSIRVGVDPHAALAIEAGTSGGGVQVDGLALESARRERSHVRGQLNGGGGRLSATTSGGSIRIYASNR